jgi:hypothetical protein
MDRRTRRCWSAGLPLPLFGKSRNCWGKAGSAWCALHITESNRIQLVLSGLQNRTSGLYSAAIKRTLISLVPNNRKCEELVEQLSHPPAGSAPLAFQSVYAAPLMLQYRTILRKNLTCYWRRCGRFGLNRQLVACSIGRAAESLSPALAPPNAMSRSTLLSPCLGVIFWCAQHGSASAMRKPLLVARAACFALHPWEAARCPGVGFCHVFWLTGRKLPLSGVATNGCYVLRSPQYNFVRYVMTTFIALAFGLFYWNKGGDT